MNPILRREPERIAGEAFDVVVIGGGILGVACSLEAARRGLRPLLIERDDFGGATSWNSLRIVHGGLRYIKDLDLQRFRESLAERRWFLARFPELVRPLPCLMPLDGRGLRVPTIFRLAFFVEATLGHDRNRGLLPSQCVPAGRVVGPEATSALCPMLRGRTLRGGALWYDAVMASERLLIELLRWAATLGAKALNYVEAVSLVAPGGRVAGVEAQDRRSGRRLLFRTRLVLNCAGPWARDLASRFDQAPPTLFRPSLAFNLLLDRPPPAEAALALTATTLSGGTYFLLPFHGRVLAGTFHRSWHGGMTEHACAEADHIEAALAELNSVLPALALGPEDVLGVRAGFLPARYEGEAAMARRAVIHDHGSGGGPSGFISATAVKWSTARRLAEKVLERGVSSLGQPLPRPAPTPPPPVRHVPHAMEFLALAAADAPAATALLRRMMEEEAALELEDLLLRRTDWSSDPALYRSLAQRAKQLLGSRETIGA